MEVVTGEVVGEDDLLVTPSLQERFDRMHSPSIKWEEWRSPEEMRMYFRVRVNDEWYKRASRTQLQMLQAAVETFKMLAAES